MSAVFIGYILLYIHRLSLGSWLALVEKRLHDAKSEIDRLA